MDDNKMTIEKNGNYFEEPIKMLFKLPHPVQCKDCKCNPEIFSQRERIENNRVLLLGIKIHCEKCNKSLDKEHPRTRNTIHPDDATVYIVIEEWNKKNGIN